VGDHATNIAEMVLFMIRAKDVRRNAAASAG
jgi:phosphate uptake regulator